MDSLSKRFVAGLERIGREITENKMKALQKVDGANLPVKYFVYMKVIQDLQPVTPGGLAEALGLTKPAVTAIMQRMEGDGCIVRRRSPDDGRVMLVELTPKGEKVADAFGEAGLVFADKARGRLSEAEFMLFIELMERLAGPESG